MFYTIYFILVTLMAEVATKLRFVMSESEMTAAVEIFCPILKETKKEKDQYQ